MSETKRIMGDQEFRSHINNLVDQLKMSGKPYTMVVGVSRGGLVPAVYLSHALGIPMMTLDYSTSNHGRGITLAYTQQTAALVVDDIADTGQTLVELCAKNPNADFATLIYKPHTSRFKPTYYANIQETDEWVVFPWEKE